MMMKIPIVLWGSQPPAHQITCMTVCDNGVVVTGSLEGQIIFWTIPGGLDAASHREVNHAHAHITNPLNNNILPQNLIIAHSSSVESLVNINNNKLNINSGIISLADNQELCLWNSETCCCLTSTVLQGRFHSLKIIPFRCSRSMRESILAAFGFQETINLIDPFTFNIIYILKQRINKCYIKTVRSLSAAFIEGLAEETLLATTHDGSLVMFRLPTAAAANSTNKNLGNPIKEPIRVDGSRVDLAITTAQNLIRGVVIEPTLSEYFILYSLTNIYFYNFSTFTLINYIIFDNNIMNIFFINPRAFIVTFEKSFPIYYYFDDNFDIYNFYSLIDYKTHSPRLECAHVFRAGSENGGIYLFGATTASEVVGWRLGAVGGQTGGKLGGLSVDLIPPLAADVNTALKISGDHIGGENGGKFSPQTAKITIGCQTPFNNATNNIALKNNGGQICGENGGKNKCLAADKQPAACNNTAFESGGKFFVGNGGKDKDLTTAANNSPFPAAFNPTDNLTINNAENNTASKNSGCKFSGENGGNNKFHTTAYNTASNNPNISAGTVNSIPTDKISKTGLTSYQINIPSFKSGISHQENIKNQFEKFGLQFHTSTLAAHLHQTLSQVWENNSPVGAASNLIESLDTSVGCSLQLEEYGFMIFGMKNGTIAITNMIDILKRQILDENSTNLSTLLLRGHDGEVTCLCHPYDECNKHNPCHLLSGGVDFSVRLWNIVDGAQLKVYYPHGGFIQEIFVLPGDLGSLNNLTVISVASDYSVALINLSYEKAVLRTRSHTSPVYSVKWKTKEDSLLVYCTDGTLFVWQITTGNLERCVTGKTAVDIFETNQDEFLDNSGIENPAFLDVVNIDNQDLDKLNVSLYKDLKTKRGFMNSHRHAAHVLPTKKKIFQRVLRKMSRKHRSNVNFKTKDDNGDKSKDKDPIQESIAHSQAHPQIQHITITGINHPLNSQHHSSACNLASTGQTGSQLSLSNTSNVNQGYHHPFEVLSLRTGHHDPDFHVFIIDFDSLISLLVHEEDRSYSGHSIVHKHASTFLLFSQAADKDSTRIENQKNASRDSMNVLTLGLCPTSDLQAYKKYYQTLEDYRAYILVSTAKLLISCLHPWGLEPQLDAICKKNLDLCQPSQPVCFGFMSRHKLQLNMPGWSSGLLYTKNLIDKEMESGESESDFCASIFKKFFTHWQISSVITGQHLVALIAVANSVLNIFLMEMYDDNVVESERHKDPLSRIRISKTMSIDSPSGRTFVTTSVPDFANEETGKVNEQYRRYWKLLFGRYCSVITVLIKKNIYYQNPCIHELVCYWLDSYDEIRHASYCILIHELQNMSYMSRVSLVRSWCLYLPTEEQVENIDIEELLKLPLDDYVESGGFYGFWPSDRKYQRTIAIFLVCFIICEFPQEFDPLCQKNASPSNLISVSTIILLSSIMSKLIKTMVNVKNFSQYPMRKAFLFFLGRAFSVWRPHINLSQILMVILDTNAYIEYYLQYLESQNRGKSHQYLQLNELLSKYRSSLREIMMTNAEVFITVINKEYPRYSSANSYVSMGQSSLVAAVAVSNVRHQQNLLNSQPSRIHLVGSEIVYLIDLMAKKCPEKFIKLIMDTIDLLLSCSFHKISKRESDFLAYFPFLKQFHMIDFCAHTRRLVVGTTNGQFGVYDMKSMRCTLINNFQHPVTCLKICPDGRQLVTYCYEEMRICVWIMQVSILGLLSHTPKPKMSFQLKNKPITNINELRKIHIVWNNSSSFRLVFNDNSELSFTT